MQPILPSRASCLAARSPSITTLGRFPRLLLCAPLAFATCRSCYRATCLLALLFAQIADGFGALRSESRNSSPQWPARVRSVRRFSESSCLGCAHTGRKVHESRCCPPMVRRRGTLKPRLADSRTPHVTRSTYQGPFDGPSIAPTFPADGGIGFGTRST